MKKCLVTILAFILTTAMVPSVAQAQFYSGYIYNNNAYMNYAMASQRARAAGRAGKKGRVKRQSHRRKAHSRKHTRNRSHKR